MYPLSVDLWFSFFLFTTINNSAMKLFYRHLHLRVYIHLIHTSPFVFLRDIVIEVESLGQNMCILLTFTCQIVL